MPHQTGKEINSICARGDRNIAHILNVIHTHLLHIVLILLSGFLQRMISEGDTESDGGRCG